MQIDLSIDVWSLFKFFVNFYTRRVILVRVGLLLKEVFREPGWKRSWLGVETCGVAAGALSPVVDLDLWHRWAPSLSAEGASRGFHPHHGSFLFCVCVFKFCLFLYFGCAGFPLLRLGFSWRWRLQGAGASVAAVPGLWGTGSIAVVHGLSCCSACGTFTAAPSRKPASEFSLCAFLSQPLRQHPVHVLREQPGLPGIQSGVPEHVQQRVAQLPQLQRALLHQPGRPAGRGLSVQTGLPPAGERRLHAFRPHHHHPRTRGGQIPQPAWPEQSRGGSGRSPRPPCPPGRGPQVRNIPVLEVLPVLPVPARLPPGLGRRIPHVSEWRPAPSVLCWLWGLRAEQPLCRHQPRRASAAAGPWPGRSAPVSAGRKQGTRRVCSGAPVRGAHRYTETPPWAAPAEPSQGVRGVTFSLGASIAAHPPSLSAALFSFWPPLGKNVYCYNLHIFFFSSNTNRLPCLIDLTIKCPLCHLEPCCVLQLPGDILCERSSGFQIRVCFWNSEVGKRTFFFFKVGLKQIQTKAISIAAN